MVKLTVELDCPACSEEITKITLFGGSSIETMQLKCGNCNVIFEMNYDEIARMLGRHEKTEDRHSG